jgi:hypothetical protein
MTNWDWFLDHSPKKIKTQTQPKESWRTIASSSTLAKTQIIEDPNVLFKVVDHYNACMCGGSGNHYGECETEDATFLDLLIEYRTLKESDFIELDKSTTLNWHELSKHIPLSVTTLQSHANEVDWHYISYSDLYDKTLDFCELFRNHIVWNKVRILNIQPKEIPRAITLIPFCTLLTHRVLSIQDIQNHIDKLNIYSNSKSLITSYSIQEIESLEDENDKLRNALLDNSDIFARKCCTIKYFPKKYPDILSQSTIPALEIIKNIPIDEQFINKYLLTKLSSECWSYLSKGTIPLSDEFILKHQKDLNFHDVAKWKKLDSTFYDKLSPQLLSKFQKLTPEYIDLNASTLDWFSLCEYQELPEWLMKKHQDKLYWGQISSFQKLSQEFIEEFKGKLNEHKLSMNQHLKVSK